MSESLIIGWMVGLFAGFILLFIALGVYNTLREVRKNAERRIYEKPSDHDVRFSSGRRNNR